MSEVPSCDAATMPEIILVPSAPKSCCIVLITALPSAFKFSGRYLSATVKLFPICNAWPMVKIQKIQAISSTVSRGVNAKKRIKLLLQIL